MRPSNEGGGTLPGSGGESITGWDEAPLTKEQLAFHERIRRAELEVKEPFIARSFHGILLMVAVVGLFGLLSGLALSVIVMGPLFILIIFAILLVACLAYSLKASWFIIRSMWFGGKLCFVVSILIAIAAGAEFLGLDIGIPISVDYMLWSSAIIAAFGLVAVTSPKRTP